MIKQDIIASLKDLISISNGIFSDYNYSELLTSINPKCFDKIQSYKPELLVTICNNIRNNKGIEDMEKYRKIVILECLLDNWNDMFSEKYPQCIQEQFEKSSKRMLNMCQSERGWSAHTEDVYWKDLAISRQQMFPAGAQIVEVYSGFGLTQGFSVNPYQSFRFLKLLIRKGGRLGYYQIHTHTPELSEFNEQGWNDCYIRIAEMLKKYKEVKGMFGGSWFYDPQLEFISPRLMYLRNIPLNNGAISFYVGEDRTGNALVKSKTRIKLYEEGKYKPKSYLLVWPRKELIKWASAYK